MVRNAHKMRFRHVLCVIHDMHGIQQANQACIRSFHGGPTRLKAVETFELLFPSTPRTQLINRPRYSLLAFVGLFGPTSHSRRLDYNKLTTLPDGVFDNLGSLNNL